MGRSDAFWAGVLCGLFFMLGLSLFMEYLQYRDCQHEVLRACIAKCGDSYACRAKCKMLADNLVECK